MQHLIDKLNAAAGPDRALDNEIARAVGAVTLHKVEADEPAVEISPHYTGSLDAAVTLIPEDTFWMMGYGKDRPDEPIGGAQVFLPCDDELPIGEGEGPTVALAVCIAALEARAALDAAHEPGCICPLCEAANAMARGANDH